jgi:hypothetical protein
MTVPSEAFGQMLAVNHFPWAIVILPPVPCVTTVHVIDVIHLI